MGGGREQQVLYITIVFSDIYCQLSHSGPAYILVIIDFPRRVVHTTPLDLEVIRVITRL